MFCFKTRMLLNILIYTYLNRIQKHNLHLLWQRAWPEMMKTVLYINRQGERQECATTPSVLQHFLVLNPLKPRLACVICPCGLKGNFNLVTVWVPKFDWILQPLGFVDYAKSGYCFCQWMWGLTTNMSSGHPVGPVNIISSDNRFSDIIHLGSNDYCNFLRYYKGCEIIQVIAIAGSTSASGCITCFV